MAWRKGLSELQEIEGITLTPYEKNLEFWRQLWRVIERSDVIVQIVDARNPLLFRCEDLECYVHEVSKEKTNLVLINKADFLSEKQREYWAEYFTSINLNVAFFSALEENQAHQLRLMKIEEGESEREDEDESNDESAETADESSEPETTATEPDYVNVSSPVDETVKAVSTPGNSQIKNSTRLLSRGELIDLLKTIHRGVKVQGGERTVAGLVGYPNVGKSSTINSLLTYKKVSVSATPGKTKHFQVNIIKINMQNYIHHFFLNADFEY
jgi:large subunit GTPase 1